VAVVLRFVHANRVCQCRTRREARNFCVKPEAILHPTKVVNKVALGYAACIKSLNKCFAGSVASAIKIPKFGFTKRWSTRLTVLLLDAKEKRPGVVRGRFLEEQGPCTRPTSNTVFAKSGKLIETVTGSCQVCLSHTDGFAILKMRCTFRPAGNVRSKIKRLCAPTAANRLSSFIARLKTSGGASTTFAAPRYFLGDLPTCLQRTARIFNGQSFIKAFRFSSIYRTLQERAALSASHDV